MGYQAGDRVGDYQVVDVLGFGGMGQVYKVQNVISKRVEAMKVLLEKLEGNTQLADRFTQEIEVQASLDHPNIAALRTAQRVGDQLVMIMEFVEGVSVDTLLRSGPVPVDKALDYTIQVLRALAYAHSRGIVHRDIKPANMMLMPNGTVKLLDFGIAKIADRKLTQTGHTLGSLFYMSPEQINDPHNIDARSDLYSVGVALYEMVTGRRPFQGDSDFSIMMGHLTKDPDPPIQVDPALPAALSDVILMSIAKERERRFQSAEAFQRALETVRAELGQPTVVMQPGSTAAAPPAPVLIPAAAPAPAVRGSRRGVYVAAGSLATVALLLLAAWQGPKLFRPTVAAPGTQVQTPAVQPQTAAEPPEQPAPATVPEPVAAVQTETPAPARPQPAAVGRPRPSEPVTAAVTPAAPAVVTPAKPAAASVAAPVAEPAAANAAVLKELGRDLSQMGTRARVALRTLGTLREQQARSGLGLRGDILAAQQTMEMQLDRAEGALKAGDSEEAREALRMADRELERIERFLGR